MLSLIEAQGSVVRAVAEKVCAGLAGVSDFPALARAYQCGEAALSWARTCPDLACEWERLQRRILAVMTALTALDAADGLPPVPFGEHPG